MSNRIHANIVYWQSIKYKRVTRSVLAFKLYVIALGFDQGSVIKATLESILNKKQILLVICTNSCLLFDYLVKLGTIYKKRLIINIICLRQSYKRQEIAEVLWINSNTNPADAMTKSRPYQVLKELIDTNKVNIEPIE